MSVVKFKSIVLYFVASVIVLSLGSCKDSRGKTENAIAQGRDLGSFKLTGKLTFDEYIAYRELSAGVSQVSLPELQVKRLGNGIYPWRHEDGDIIMAKGCGANVNRLVVLEETGKETIVSPCSGEIANPGASSSRFEFSRLSPDKSLVAAEVRYYLNGGVRYSTVIIRDGAIQHVFDNFAAPEWLPDGRLLLASDGMYITEIDGTPQKIDDGTLSSGPNNPDLDPTGKIIAFEWNQRIWTMGIDGSNLKELVTGNYIFRFPAWSPDGKYIAFLGTSGGDSASAYSEGVYIIEVATGENIFIDLSAAFNALGKHVPKGPLSWTE